MNPMKPYIEILGAPLLGPCSSVGSRFSELRACVSSVNSAALPLYIS